MALKPVVPTNLKVGDRLSYVSFAFYDTRVPKEVEVVEPASPYAKGCALVRTVGAKYPFDGEWNAEYGQLFVQTQENTR